jgi:hypothetical protein
MTFEQIKAQLHVSEPVRKIGRGHRGFRGRMTVHGNPIEYESSLEHDFLELIAFDHTVTKIREQPVRISFRDRRGRCHRYTPDFFVVHRPVLDDRIATSFLYEIKYRTDLFRDWKNLKPKFLEARSFAREHDMVFRIMTEVEIRGEYLQNVRVLNRHRYLPRDSGFEDRLTAKLVELGESTPRALLEAAWNDDETRVRGASYILRLIATGDIDTDMTEPITMKSPIWTECGGNGGYQWCPYSHRSRPV